MIIYIFPNIEMVILMYSCIKATHFKDEYMGQRKADKGEWEDEKKKQPIDIGHAFPIYYHNARDNEILLDEQAHSHTFQWIF